MDVANSCILGAIVLGVRSAMLVPIERPEAAFSKSLLGGKGFNLAKIAKEFPKAVPKAVVVPTLVYKEHVASIADLKVPCVTNCTNATSLLVDGEVVVVDGTAGTVRRRNAQSFL